MYEGVINILKPPGMTSSNVVSDVRRILSEKRVGHTGTLDPGAAGVLPVCAGRATRLFDYLLDKQKEYIAQIHFGMSTDTQDAYGVVTERDDAVVTSDRLAAVLPEFMGEITQCAPMHSAVSVNGTRLYKLARQGIEIERAMRTVHIYALELISHTAPNSFLIRIRCSKGTYVRTLCCDIGKRLGTCAYMSYLLRSASGMFDIDSAYTLGELEGLKATGRLSEAIVSIEDALGFMTDAHIRDNHAVHLFINGAEVRPGRFRVGDGYIDGEPLRVYGAGEFLGIGKLTDEGLKMMVHLAPDGYSVKY